MTRTNGHTGPTSHPDTQDFDGRTVLITGGTSGMGLATARVLLDRGANVVITGRDDARLRRAEAELDSGERVFAVRADSARPDDPRLAELIGELSLRSPEFRHWWAEHPVRDKTSGHKVFHHPLVGRLELVYETLRSADDPDQALVTCTADLASPSDDALRMLIAWEADHTHPHPARTE
ncbi:SDR family NAD(P)-dependent oxidoreductase [Kitasatospora misakiensis]|uniref:SDR family NAD(P)-dependent oxidoreductase n=1 Tax=Kitasatospora misakiensis TaxID=67330 RepID=A0ABW0X7M7_9ACTN